MGQVKLITKKSDDISGWYNDVVEKSQLVEHGPVKGTMIWRPRGYALWEAVQKHLDIRIKDLGAQNCYFPLLIPYSFLQKEESHVKGFSPELAVVTHAGGEKLADPAVVRPTSETIMYDAYSRWIQSFRDLPLILNQWNSVVRWEKRPYLLIRPTEFLWQEGHSAHETDEEAQTMAENAMKAYVDFYQNVLGLYGYSGKKSATEKFPGAKETLTYEILAPDGKPIQSCTSHNLGDNFAKVFKVQYQDREGKQNFVHQTSWGLSCRSLGALILVHGDDNGLVLPPMIAPVQAVIVPIVSKSSDGTKILNMAKKALEILQSNDVRVKLDDSDQSPGWKFNQYELEGVPLRIEIGATEANTNKYRVKRRDNSQSIDIEANLIGTEVTSLLKEIQSDLFEKSKKQTHDNTRQADTYDQFKEIMNSTRGFIEAFWCEDEKCEKSIKDETKASTRCLRDGTIAANGACVYCNKPAKYRWLFGQSY